MSDSVLRAIADDGSFRVIAARTTSTVTGACAAQRCAGDVARVFGDLLTGAVLVRETMAPGLRVQGIVKREGARGGLVADAHPDGSTRGLVNGGATAATASAGALLQMMRTLPNGALHQGIVEVPTKGGVSAALMEYMATSEQVDSVVAVATLVEGDRVTAAGGYIVQLLPEASRDVLRVVTERLEALPAIEALIGRDGGEPGALVGALLEGVAFTRIEERPLRFGCHCSHDRVLASLATLRRAELTEMLTEQRFFEIDCDYCGAAYRVGPGDLRGLLGAN